MSPKDIKPMTFKEFVFPSKRRDPDARRRNRSFEGREFISWDGEGWTDHHCSDPEVCTNLAAVCKHHYCLFGASSGDSVSGTSLSTKECFDLMLKVREENPYAIHVGFAFDYDVNMILKDLEERHLRLLRKNTHVYWKGYKIEHIPKKWIQVTDVAENTTVRIQDAFGFFATSFVNALKGWDVGTEQELAKIAKGKEARNEFALDSLDKFIRPYWELELKLLVRLMDTLRERLYSAGVKSSRWYGPGCVANVVFSSHDIQDRMDQNLDPAILEASQYAYAGGRFELIRGGLYTGPVYCADINSAYPYAMSLLPNLQTGQWVHQGRGIEPDSQGHERLAMYRIEYHMSDAYRDENPAFIGPVFRRDRHGAVDFPPYGRGWYHAPEARILMDLYYAGVFQHFTVLESWVYLDDGSSPFLWIRDMYNLRKVWKAAGNPAEKALKLCLNSLYGKMAQRTGGKQGPPKWHQLEWAGAITSQTRAMLYNVASWSPEHVISLDTDGIYSTRPLEILPEDMGSGLGQWEMTEYTGILAMQSGVYWLKNKDGQWMKPKSRGVPSKDMDVNEAMMSFRTGIPMRVNSTQFIGYGKSLMHAPALRGWRTWRTDTREFKFGSRNGKRLHSAMACPACADKVSLMDGLHTLVWNSKMLTRGSDGNVDMTAVRMLKEGKSLMDVHASHKHDLPWSEGAWGLREHADTNERWGIYDA